jgi:rhomboid protease GluP
MFGDGWRLVTSVLVHVDVVHVLVNALGMVALGRLGESRVGAGAWSACFWLGGLVGSLASYAAGVAQSDGASGAIFAWLALVAVQASGAQGERSTRLVSARMLWAVIVGNLVLGLLVPAIDVIAHVGGLCAGLLWAFILTKPWASIVGPGVNLCAGLVVVYGLGMCWGAA